MFHLTDVNSMSSTLVETVSINYDDFSDSFLTCGTCLSMFDSVEHNPKLLTCSHTICHSCLERMIAVEGPNATTFRCPICRETITIPRGGVPAFPPSFIVNQLLDLMAGQRRDVVPKCAVHSQSELLFCESCDTVFCADCTGGSHNSRGASAAHTVIPFSVAIKRMSEILLYKASQCMKNLDAAALAVNEELGTLDRNAEQCVQMAGEIFQELVNMVEKRQREIVQTVKRVRDDKKKVLREQLDIIEAEKVKLRDDCDGLQHQIEVRTITTKIGHLNEKLDMSTTLSEPRENAYVHFDYRFNSAMDDIAATLGRFGKIEISKTFPALCTAVLDPVFVSHLRASIVVKTVDYYGNVQTTGGDPVMAELRGETGAGGETKRLPVRDNEDGTYVIDFIPKNPGLHRLYVRIFNRCIKRSPFDVDVTEHNNPVARIGRTGSGELEFRQPVNIVASRNDGRIYVLDTGNSRIKVLGADGSFVRHIAGPGLEQHSGTGMAMTPDGKIVVVNWRTKRVTTIDVDNEVVAAASRCFTCDGFVEPVAVTTNSRGEVVVADNAVGKLFVFDGDGKLLRTIGSKGDAKGQMKLVSYVYSAPNDDLLVCDHRVQAFSRTGDFLYDFPPAGTPVPVPGQFGGVTVDSSGNYLLTKSERGRCVVQVYSPSRQWLFNVDSFADKLKRPSGLVALADGHVYVVDLGNDCIKKFRYI